MRGLAGVDQLTHVPVDLHDLEDAQASLEPAVVTLPAPLAPAERPPLARVQPGVDQHLLDGVVVRRARGTDHPRQPLGDDALQSARDQVRFDAHVHQSRNRPRRVVGVQSGEDDVAGQGGLDRHAGCLLVANLAHHHHVGILPQQAPQHPGEGQPDRFLHLHLVDIVQPILDRILGGDDVPSRPAQQIDRRVQRGRLAAPGRSRDQQEPVRAGQHAAHALQRSHTHTQIRQLHLEVVLVQDADDELLAEQRRHAGHAKIDLTSFRDDVDAALLWQTALTDVHLADDLDARDDGRVHPRRWIHEFAQNAVDPLPHARPAVGGFDVDVAGAGLDRGQQGDVDQRDDRAALDHLVEIRGRIVVDRLLLDDLDVGFGQGRQERVDIDVARGVLAHKLQDVALQREHGPDLAASQRAHAVDRGQRLRLGHRQRQRLADAEHRDDLESFGLFGTDEFEQRRIDQAVPELAALHTQAVRQRPDQDAGRNDSLFNQHLAEQASGAALHGQGGFELFVRDDALADERLTDPGWL